MVNYAYLANGPSCGCPYRARLMYRSVSPFEGEGGAVGGSAPANTSTTTDYNYTTDSSVSAQSQFIFGVNTEVVMRRGLLSGYNCTAAPIFLEANLAENVGKSPKSPKMSENHQNHRK